MTYDTDPRPLLIRAYDDLSPLRTTDAEAHADIGDFARDVPLDDPGLGLSGDLADRLDSWNRARPPGGFTTRAVLRKHVEQGLEAARALARHLGPAWAVRYWDERHRTAKFVCWGCRRLHWTVDAHGAPPYPVHIVVEGEYKWLPLRAEEFGDFAPDDPAAALGLSDDLIAALYQWAKDIDAVMERWLTERDDAARDAAYERLDREGRQLTRRVARALGPGRTVTYGGVG
ncbi:hypothetical protein ACFOOM_32095 [Streptomyces echinoruber]|uniref:Uncharacterized protein n=1 Tax=Streptomyces echinoruber TaxID=68898 RepID=A0A918VNK9_9ACTN|nr:hypothetical protein [Streptomyces echinoruber]GHA10452.1 hypothetical protein GCM10010389_56920 [Streptomyces echinoruber]